MKRNFKILATTGCAVIMGLPLAAQSGEGSVDPFYMEHLFSNMLLIISGIVIVAGLLTILFLSNMLMNMQKLDLMRERGIEPQVKPVVRKESLWSRFYKLATDRVPVEKEEDILMDHNYDGIKELDNSLPPWWLWLFYITILFAVVHMVYYVFTDMGPGQIEQYEMKKAQAEEEVAKYLEGQAEVVDETNVTFLEDPAALEKGKSIFINLCAACHGQMGEGGVGPNMTDLYYVHGGRINDIFSVIKYGVPEKGMISWKSQLTPEQMQMVSSYIMTLRGTDPPNQKEPEGELYIPEEEDTVTGALNASDTTATE